MSRAYAPELVDGLRWGLAPPVPGSTVTPEMEARLKVQKEAHNNEYKRRRTVLETALENLLSDMQVLHSACSTVVDAAPVAPVMASAAGVSAAGLRDKPTQENAL